MNSFFLVLVISMIIVNVFAGTSITVVSEYKKEINVKIQGAGVGGCDIILQPGETNNSDCWCLWGTLNYAFCAYSNGRKELSDSKEFLPNNSTASDGHCPKVTGESIVCNDLASLGNCYSGAYKCTVDSTSLCHCEVI